MPFLVLVKVPMSMVRAREQGAWKDGEGRRGWAQEHMAILGCSKIRMSELPTDIGNKLIATKGEEWRGGENKLGVWD